MDDCSEHYELEVAGQLRLPFVLAAPSVHRKIHGEPLRVVRDIVALLVRALMVSNGSLDDAVVAVEDKVVVSVDEIDFRHEVEEKVVGVDGTSRAACYALAQDGLPRLPFELLALIFRKMPSCAPLQDVQDIPLPSSIFLLALLSGSSGEVLKSTGL